MEMQRATGEGCRRECAGRGRRRVGRRRKGTGRGRGAASGPGPGSQAEVEDAGGEETSVRGLAKPGSQRTASLCVFLEPG